jgi:type IV secretory pathway VirB2 component (pilin)
MNHLVPRKRTLFLVAALALFLLAASSLHAGSTDGELPFNEGLGKLLENFQGPTGTALLLMAIVWGLIKWSGSERGSSGLIQAAKGGVSLAVIATLVLTLGSLGIAAASL